MTMPLTNQKFYRHNRSTINFSAKRKTVRLQQRALSPKTSGNRFFNLSRFIRTFSMLILLASIITICLFARSRDALSTHRRLPGELEEKQTGINIDGKFFEPEEILAMLDPEGYIKVTQDGKTREYICLPLPDHILGRLTPKKFVDGAKDKHGLHFIGEKSGGAKGEGGLYASPKPESDDDIITLHGEYKLYPKACIEVSLIKRDMKDGLKDILELINSKVMWDLSATSKVPAVCRVEHIEE